MIEFIKNNNELNFKKDFILHKICKHHIDSHQIIDGNEHFELHLTAHSVFHSQCISVYYARQQKPTPQFE